MADSITHIILDFDDTLIVSHKYFFENTVTTAKALGLKKIPTEKEVVAYGTCWDDFIHKTWPDISVANYKAKFKEIAEDIHYPCIPGANETLDKLSQSHVLYILSKRPKEMMGLRIKQSGLRTDLFKRVYCNEDVIYKKPDPRTFEEIFLDISASGKLDKSSTLSVGDTLDDMAASLGAGLNFAAVTTGYFKREDFIGKGLPPKQILNSVNELPLYLENNHK
jgi:phosphoglycolate phosphatase-like HAD superfamily hydrolase